MYIRYTCLTKKPREYRKTIVPGIDEQWQADLVEMKEFSEHNYGYNYDTIRYEMLF